MKPPRRAIAFSLLSVALGAVLSLAGTSRASAQKLPVDCSGRKSDCTTVRSCTEWHEHVCYEYTANMWYWYY
jgi:hypothetical protein